MKDERSEVRNQSAAGATHTTFEGANEMLGIYAAKLLDVWSSGDGLNTQRTQENAGALHVAQGIVPLRQLGNHEKCKRPKSRNLFRTFVPSRFRDLNLSQATPFVPKHSQTFPNDSQSIPKPFPNRSQMFPILRSIHRPINTCRFPERFHDREAFFSKQDFCKRLNTDLTRPDSVFHPRFIRGSSCRFSCNSCNSWFADSTRPQCT
jgi:hypothetical protein